MTENGSALAPPSPSSFSLPPHPRRPQAKQHSKASGSPSPDIRETRGSMADESCLMRRAIVVPLVEALGSTSPGLPRSCCDSANVRYGTCLALHATILHPVAPWQHRGSCF